ncbi:MAG: hypothetical protein RBU29_08405 [bacterium]|jgi:hypothetical protein|nr:hypothetical protein [bacterium]
MLQKVAILMIVAFCCAGCSSGGAKGVGNSVGSALRAPVDFFAGIGSGMQGGPFSPHRPFNPDFEKQKSDPIFWEDDVQFFSAM